MATARSIHARFARVEHAAVRVCAKRNTIQAWTERFADAHPDHGAVLDQITARARIHTKGMLSVDTVRMHAGHAFISMLHQVPFIMEPPEFGAWPIVKDAPEALELMSRFVDMLIAYQRRTGDLCPGPGLWGIRELIHRKAPLPPLPDHLRSTEELTHER